MKYFDMYLAGLYDAIAEGGTQDVVDKVITEINNPTQAGLDAYLVAHGAVGPCGVCGDPFTFEDHKPTLDEEVLCQDCKKPRSPT